MTDYTTPTLRNAIEDQLHDLCLQQMAADVVEAELAQWHYDKYTDAIITTVVEYLERAMPGDDIDEELSGRYDLVIPQEVAGYRVCVSQVKAILNELRSV